VIRRWRQRRQQDWRERLIVDIHRTAGLMRAVIVDARRLGVEVPDGVEVAVWIWRSWADRLAE
jgi:hypothetical protein